MDYKKEYKGALARCKWLLSIGMISEIAATDMFRELIDNDSENIRKEIISILHSLAEGKIPVQINFANIFTWLEKQSEHANFLNKIQVGDKVTRNKDGMLVNLSQLNRVAKKDEKQGEHKKINLVEVLKHYPKETELYSPLYGKLWLAEVDEKHEIIICYKYRLAEGCTRAILEQEDTVSFYSNGTTGLPDFSVSKDCMLFLYDIEKQGEQNLLDNVAKQVTKDKETATSFLKSTGIMDENGELAEPYRVCESTSNWSEGDEEMYKEVLTDIIYAKNDMEAKECLGLSKRAMKAFNWFSKRCKSLRPQTTWKPSSEQMYILNWVANILLNHDGIVEEEASKKLQSLYNDLKKLIEE